MGQPNLSRELPFQTLPLFSRTSCLGTGRPRLALFYETPPLITTIVYIRSVDGSLHDSLPKVIGRAMLTVRGESEAIPNHV
jgi:hypothetical protein